MRGKGASRTKGVWSAWGFPLKEKAAHSLHGLFKKKARLLDGNRNLCAMNECSGDCGDGKGVGAALCVGRSAATATPRATTGGRGVSAAADCGESRYRENDSE